MNRSALITTLIPALHPRKHFVKIFRVAICLLYVVIPSLPAPVGEARDLLFLTPPGAASSLYEGGSARHSRVRAVPAARISESSSLCISRVYHPRPFSDPFFELSRVGVLSSLARSQDSGEAPQSTAPSGKHPVERGYAAFYSPSLEGHKTACGGVYSSTKLTAAHHTLPCGTKLRVTNLHNGKTVRVTVNDRLPASRDRILDLSYAAAQALNFIPQGTTLVKVEVLR